MSQFPPLPGTSPKEGGGYILSLRALCSALGKTPGSWMSLDSDKEELWVSRENKRTKPVDKEPISQRSPLTPTDLK